MQKKQSKKLKVPCIVCGHLKLEKMGKDEVHCDNCNSQYPYTRLMRLSKKAK